MKKLLIAFSLGLMSVTAVAETIVPVRTIDMFAITKSDKLIITGTTGAYTAPLSNCNLSSVKEMEQPNIFFLRSIVAEDMKVVIYDQKNRKHRTRCHIEKLEKHDKLYLAKI